MFWLPPPKAPFGIILPRESDYHVVTDEARLRGEEEPATGGEAGTSRDGPGSGSLSVPDNSCKQPRTAPPGMSGRGGDGPGSGSGSGSGPDGSCKQPRTVPPGTSGRGGDGPGSGSGSGSGSGPDGSCNQPRMAPPGARPPCPGPGCAHEHCASAPVYVKGCASLYEFLTSRGWTVWWLLRDCDALWDAVGRLGLGEPGAVDGAAAAG
ncbi:hypothetical protein FOA52_000135 [Chlamydomonas sp. UWO 241]|nr:hypothetical protein FOA52_000135 [Chlamydomonas sp. UWO 241]